MYIKEKIYSTEFKDTGKDGFKIKGKLKDKNVKARFKGNKTHKISGEIFGKIKDGGKLIAAPDEIDCTKKRDSKFEKIAEKAFRKIKKLAKSEGLSTNNLRLKIDYNTLY